MRKKSQDELGTLVTREMKVMLQDESLTKEQRFDILSSVMFDAPLKNTLMSSFANSLKAGFEQINISRYRAIEREREWRKNTERRRRHAGYLDENATTSNPMSPHVTPCHTMSPHDGLKQNKTKQGISPYKPPKGGGKVPKAIEAEDLLKGGPKKGGGRCRFTDANGYCTNKNMQGGGFKCAGPGCEGREEVDEESPATPRDCAEILADAIEKSSAFARMRVNRRNLMRHLLPLAEKNSARLAEWAKEVLDGLDAWTAAWKADDWQYAPGKITKWLVDEKYLQPPRKKTAAPESVGSGCGDCGAEIA